MNKIYQQIEKVIADLKRTGKVKLNSADFRYYAGAVSDELLQSAKGLIIDEFILDFYRQIEFINLNWVVNEEAVLNYINADQDIVAGSLNIPSFASLVSTIVRKNSAQIIDPFKSSDEKLYSLLELYIPFDVLNGDGAVCFHVQHGKIKDELYLVKTGLENFVEPLATGVTDYFMKGADCLFFYNWQQAVFLNDITAMKHLTFYVKQLKKNYTIL